MGQRSWVMRMKIRHGSGSWVMRAKTRHGPTSTGYGLRATGYGLRATNHESRVTSYGSGHPDNDLPQLRIGLDVRFCCRQLVEREHLVHDGHDLPLRES